MGNNVIAKGVFDGWQLSGLSTFLSGTRSNFTYNFSGAAPSATTLTGGLGGSRVVIVCDPNLPRSERTFDRQVPEPNACGHRGRSRTRPTRSIRAPGLAPDRKMRAWVSVTSTTT